MSLRSLSATLAVILLGAALGSCGFHLRGVVNLPQGYYPVYVSGSPQLQGELLAGLRGGGAEVTTTPAEAGARLEILGENFTRRTLSVDPDSGKAQEYEIAFQVGYRLVGPEGEVLLAPARLSLQRDYFFDTDAVLGTSRRVSTLYEEMRRDAAQRILRQINAAVGAGS